MNRALGVSWGYFVRLGFGWNEAEVECGVGGRIGGWIGGW